MDEIIRKIKEKKELSGVADSIVLEVLEKELKMLGAKEDISGLKGKDLKLLVKKVRAELRKYSGSFNIGVKKQRALLEQNKINELLKTHSSTNERFSDYHKITALISSLHPKSVLDIGSGLNPLALALSLSLKNPGLFYYALDINESDIFLVNEFFKKNSIRGKAFIYDIRKIKSSGIPSCDVCLLLKILDVVEKRGHKLAEKIISNLNCSYFIISFSSKTLSGRPMNHPQRGWIERLLARLGFQFNMLKAKNEIFYLASKIISNKAAFLPYSKGR